MPESSTKLFQYDDYRRFLGDFFEDQKRKRAVFSHRFFARKAGFTSSSFCLSVIKGRYNLSQAAMEKIARALELDTRQMEYFFCLVRFNQTRVQSERDECWARMVELRREMEFASLAKPQHRYFSRWYFPVLRELACHPSFDGDFSKLARRFEPALATEEVRKGIQDLLEWELIEEVDGGRFRSTSLLVHAEGVSPMTLRQIRREVLQFGIGALDAMPSSQRYVTLSTLAMSEETYQFALQVLEDARRRIIAKVAGDPKVDKVFAMSFQVFPLTRLLSEAKS